MNDGIKGEESTDSLPSRFVDDEFYRALSSRRRRRILAFLLDERECSRDELATVLAEWESTDTGSMSTRDDYDRIQLDLHHVQLPMLDESALVAYDPERGTVTIEPLETETRALIRRCIEAEP